jgi:hypothetical protein
MKKRRLESSKYFLGKTMGKKPNSMNIERSLTLLPGD